MTNAELIAKIKNEIESLKYVIEPMFLKDDDSYFEGENDGYDRILSFLSRLESEKPVPADLEEAANDYAEQNTEEEYHTDEGIIQTYGIAYEAFIAGYNLCKEQMMKEAVEGEVSAVILHKHGDEIHYAVTYLEGEGPHSITDKVRIIILPKKN